MLEFLNKNYTFWNLLFWTFGASIILISRTVHLGLYTIAKYLTKLNGIQLNSSLYSVADKLYLIFWIAFIIYEVFCLCFLLDTINKRNKLSQEDNTNV
jgi:hypothetical protein